MKIHTKVVWDIETGEILERESFEYQGPLEKAHGSKKTGQQTIAEQQQGASAQQQKADQAQQSALTGAAQGTLSQFEGPAQQSPFYKALYNTGVEGTSQAYDAARSNMRQRANAAGFGYNQPVEGAGETQLDVGEGEALAKVGPEALLKTGEMGLEAAKQTGGMGMGYGQQALGYGGQSLDWNQQAANLQSKRKSWLQNLRDIAGPMVQGAVQGSGYGQNDGTSSG